MIQKEKILEELSRRLLTEMAGTRSELRDYIKSKYPLVIEHLILILTQPQSTSVNHWKGEVYGCFPKFEKLKYSKKYPTKEDLLDCGMESCFESIEDQLEVYLLDVYSRELNADIFNIKEIEDIKNIKIDMNKLKTAIKEYFVWILENYNTSTGVVNKLDSYTKMNELINEYNK